MNESNNKSDTEKNMVNDPMKEIGRNAIKTYTSQTIQKNFLERIGSWFNKASKCNFDFIKQYFDVTEEIVKKRMYHSLIPFNPFFHDIQTQKPDIYGPVWIYTTLVFIIAASGEITGYLNGALETSYFEEFVPLSALMVGVI